LKKCARLLGRGEKRRAEIETSLASSILELNSFCRILKCVFFANNSELNQATREKHEIMTAFSFIQKAIVLWTYI
jgi:hypothetical protein